MNTCSQLPERAFASSLQRGVVDTTDGCSVSFSLCVRQAFVATRSGDGVSFAQAGSLQLDPVSTVHDAVQDRVANRRVADKFMPAANGDLAGDQQRALFVTVVDDFQQVASLLGGQWLRSPVVDYQQPGTFQARQQSGQPSLATRGGEFGEQSRRPPIQRREALTACLVSQSASKPTFADTGWAADHQMLALADPVTACKLVEQSAVEAAWRAEVGVLDHRVLAQACLAQPAAQPLVLSAGDLAVEQQAEPVLARDVGSGRGALHLEERIGHGGHAKGAQALGQGMDQHRLSFQ